MNGFNCQAHSARVEFDDEDAVLVGRIVGLQDTVGIHVGVAPEPDAAFHEADDGSVATRKTPKESCSGRVMFRVSPALHRAAELSGVSLDKRAEEILREEGGRLAGPRCDPCPFRPTLSACSARVTERNAFSKIRCR